MGVLFNPSLIASECEHAHRQVRGASVPRNSFRGAPSIHGMRAL